MSIYIATVRKSVSELKDLLHKYNTGVLEEKFGMGYSKRQC